jgi:hypothetical protein
MLQRCKHSDREFIRGGGTIYAAVTAAVEKKACNKENLIIEVRHSIGLFKTAGS